MIRLRRLFYQCDRRCLAAAVIGLLLFASRHALQFLTHGHIPWLSQVRNEQPLICADDPDYPAWPRAVHSFLNETRYDDDQLTVIIVTARPEFKRLPLTLAALASHLDARRLIEVTFLVPPQDAFLLEPYLTNDNAKLWPWRVSILSDDFLLKHKHTHSYRLQMIFKLCLAQVVTTEYYMILDSDCVAVWPVHVEQLLLYFPNTTAHSHYKALYTMEPRGSHSKWWPESEQLLQTEPNTCTSTDPTSATIGVTPLILSKSIALRTLCRLNLLYGREQFLSKLANWGLWRTFLNKMWTEYTLYFITARCTNTFDLYHFHNGASFLNTLGSVNLCALSVWSYDDWTPKVRHQLRDLVATGLRWRQREMTQANGGLIVDRSGVTHGLFTVLQGRQNIDPNQFHRLLYPLYIRYLREQNSTNEIAQVIDLMCSHLIEH